MHPRSKNDSEDSSWITVSQGKRRKQSAVPKQPGSDRSLTVDSLLVGYNHRMNVWRNSSCRRQVRKILDQKRPDVGWQIKRAVCFASGSFCRDNWECQKRTMIQFTAFMDIVDYLQSSSDDEIKIAARELVYTPLDIEFLANLNVVAQSSESVERSEGTSPRASEGGDSSIFVFEAFMDKTLVAVQQLFNLDVKLFVGTSSPTVGANGTTTDELKQMHALYEKFVAEYTSYYFPRFDEDSNVFEGLNISWRDDIENESG